MTVSRGDVPMLADSFAVSPADSGVIRQTLALELERGEEELRVEVELHAQGHAVFSGGQSVRLSRGASVQAEVALLPVPAEVRVAAVPVVEAIGDTVPLSGAVLFATGDTVPGAEVAWSTPDSAVVRLISGGRLVARAEGVARLTATSGGLSAEGPVTVRARVASVTVTPGADSLFVGDSLRLTATSRDRRGNALAGRTVAWSSGAAAVAAVSAAGVVTGAAPGTASVTATVEAQSASAIVAVHGLARIYGRVRNSRTRNGIASATLTLSGPGTQTRTVQPDAQGNYAFNGLRPGTYSVNAAAGGHDPNRADAVQLARVRAGDVAQLSFDLPPSTDFQPVAGVAGRVTDPQGAPVSGATGFIGGEAPGGAGFYRVAVTAADGTYAIPGVLPELNQIDVIDSFVLFAGAGGRVPVSRVAPALEGGRTVAGVNFVLAPGTGPHAYLTDGFESTSLLWQHGGMWNRTTGAGVINTAVPLQASLAPGDGSQGRLPAAPQGSAYLWYGAPATGNFRGNGSSNSGSALSPVFVVPAGVTATLTFQTWFEVEGVNPVTFDQMSIAVEDVETGAVTTLGRLNPATSPGVGTSPIPFTSGGLNLPPVFRSASVSLAGHAGKPIRIMFRFATGDANYNHFRGWIVDDVRVASQSGAAAVRAPGGLVPTPASVPAVCDARCRRSRPAPSRR